MNSLTIILDVVTGVLFLGVHVHGQTFNTHGPPKVDKNPLYLDSYIPAVMQVIIHLTELMKYESEPYYPPVSTSPSPMTTSSHKPGLYAPSVPPGHTHRLTNGVSSRMGSSDHDANESDDLELLGKTFSELYKEVNTLDRDADEGFEDEQRVFSFLQKHDDSDFVTFLRKKKPPPTRAYVTLLSLYDNLNQEAKKLGFNKYSGYSQKLLKELAEISTGTSAHQLRSMLAKLLERHDVTEIQAVKKVKILKDDLDDAKSYINLAIRYIPPLAF